MQIIQKIKAIIEADRKQDEYVKTVCPHKLKFLKFVFYEYWTMLGIFVVGYVFGGNSLFTNLIIWTVGILFVLMLEASISIFLSVKKHEKATTQ